VNREEEEVGLEDENGSEVDGIAKGEAKEGKKKDADGEPK
jgi:hypothetical protein